MLQSIRDRTHGWIAGTIVSLLILSFALWGVHSYLEGGGATTTVAKVNGVEITKSQLAVAYERLRRQLQMQYSSNYALPEQAESNLKERALQTLINIQVLKQASLDQDYRVSNRQVDSLLESMPEFKVNERFSLARFEQVLSTTLFTANDFLDLLKTSLLIDQPRLGLIFTSFALPNEVLGAINLINQERDIQYVTLSNKDFLSHPIAISNDVVETYYNAHQNDYKTQEQVSINYLELSVKDIMSAMHPSDDELKKFYNENTNAFAQPMQWKLDVILIPTAENATDKDISAAQAKATDIQAKVNKGEDFAVYSHQYSAPGLTQKLQAFVTINQIPQDLQKVVMAMTKTGQIGALTRTQAGFVILKAIDVKDAKIEPFDKVKDKVKEALTRQQAEELFSNMKDKLANMTYEHPESLQYAADNLKLPIKSSELFTKDKGGKDISSNPKIREAGFSNEVLGQKNNSDIVQLNSDSAIVVRVKQHAPATLLTLDTVRSQITDKLKAIEAEKQAAQQADDIEKKLASGASLEQIAQQYHLTWTKTGFIGRHVTKVDSAILDEAFGMPKPQAGKSTYSTIRLPTGVAVIALMGVQDGKLNNNKEQFDLFDEQMQNSLGVLEYELYKQSITNQADIAITTSS